MNNQMRPVQIRSHQRGAALVVGMLLLIVITLLAISSMNSSTLEIQMAGNTQFRQNAFQAAETGIEQAMVTNTIATDTDVILSAATVNGTTTDQYTATIHHSCAEGMSGPAIGYEVGKFSNYTFDVASTGTSARGALARNNMSFYVVGPGAC